MCGPAIKLALAASLAFVGAACAAGQEPITTASLSRSFGERGVELDVAKPVRAGFGPFLEEGLVAEVPGSRLARPRTEAPAFLRDFLGVADPW